MDKERVYSPQLKAAAVLEAIRERKGTAHICQEYGVEEELLSKWKQEFLENAPRLFDINKAESKRKKRVEEQERLVRKLAYELRIAKRALKFVLRILSVRKDVDSIIIRRCRDDLREAEQAEEGTTQIPWYQREFDTAEAMN